LGCYGDGVAIFTNDDKLAELVGLYRVHGKGEDKYDNVRMGLNSRLDTIQAPILLQNELEKRNIAAENYAKTLSEKYTTPFVPDGYYSSWSQYTVVCEDRDSEMQGFKEQGIPTMVYYRTCMHLQTAFKDLGYKEGDFPVAEKLSKQVFSLPMHGYL